MSVKIVGKNKYFHISAIHEMSRNNWKVVTEAFRIAKIHWGEHLNKVNLIKISPANISFMISPDWDTASEPRIDFAYVVKLLNGFPDNKVKLLDFRDKRIIYHHKWMFVPHNYTGFDVAESREWSEYWTNHPIVKALAKKDPKWRSKIGNYDYWKREVLDKIK